MYDHVLVSGSYIPVEAGQDLALLALRVARIPRAQARGVTVLVIVLTMSFQGFSILIWQMPGRGLPPVCMFPFIPVDKTQFHK